MTTPTTSADLWAAAGRAHDLGDPLHLALTRWLKDVDTLHQARVCVDGPENCTCTTGCQWCGDEDWPCADTRHALAVARQVLGTGEQSAGKATPAPSCGHCEHPTDWHDEWEGCVGPNGIGGANSGDCTCTRSPAQADEAQQPEVEAHPAETEWIGEVLELDGAWEYLGASPDRSVAEKRRASIIRRHPDAETRTVRKTTTYTVATDQPDTETAAAAPQCSTAAAEVPTR